MRSAAFLTNLTYLTQINIGNGASTTITSESFDRFVAIAGYSTKTITLNSNDGAIYSTSMNFFSMNYNQKIAFCYVPAGATLSISTTSSSSWYDSTVVNVYMM